MTKTAIAPMGATGSKRGLEVQQDMKIKAACALVTVALSSAPGWALADEKGALEMLRQTTLNLIDALVQQGILTREKADQLVAEAEKKAAIAAAEDKAKPQTEAVRVPYVPEVVKNEIREQLKQEVLAQAKSERWGEPNALPEWLDRIMWEGDLRMRYETNRLDSNNATSLAYAFPGINAPGVASPGVGEPGSATRAADFADDRFPFQRNATENRERWRVRLRLGMLAKVSDAWSAAVRLSTGNATDRVSTNQTLGQNFNKYSLLVNRAYVRYEPRDWLSASAGRIPNPWFGTDLVWDEDLNFEGLAATFKPKLTTTVAPFVTLGAFPIREDNPVANPKDRWLYGLQAGAQWDISSSAKLKLGVAYYRFANIEGRAEPNSAFDLTDPTSPTLVSSTYGGSEYGSGLRQRGNTLFRTNAPVDPSPTNIWGLASRFRPIDITAVLDLAAYDPYHTILAASYVKNTAFDRNEIFERTGLRLNDGKDTGYQLKLTVGMPQVRQARDWQASLAYRYLGSDAVLDAFTDSDFGLGGTNNKGYVLGFSYGLERNAWLNFRWLSSDVIDSPTLVSGDRFSVNSLQVNLNVRF